MTVTDVTQIIANLGFPIAACVALYNEINRRCRRIKKISGEVTQWGLMKYSN